LQAEAFGIGDAAGLEEVDVHRRCHAVTEGQFR